MIIEFGIFERRGRYDSDSAVWLIYPFDPILSSDLASLAAGERVEQYKPNAVREFVRRVVEPLGGRILTPAESEPLDANVVY